MLEKIFIGNDHRKMAAWLHKRPTLRKRPRRRAGLLEKPATVDEVVLLLRPSIADMNDVFGAQIKSLAGGDFGPFVNGERVFGVAHIDALATKNRLPMRRDLVIWIPRARDHTSFVLLGQTN